ncbi:hypothetical protein [Brevibacillus sp. HB2.2]|uniref:hypothetical protein n=1 Tax=Brevibacillus sp. HB2.2 TaxID=2738846 RepID=UPI00156AA85D|nr:hypothetical protein [Brevibacillus sp. HB2.2]NRS51174.1 hypothetical protein [Brevibacillus sp. HB2.2]
MISTLNKTLCVQQLVEKLRDKQLLHVPIADLRESNIVLYEYVNQLNDSIAIIPTTINSVITGVIRFQEGYFITLGMLIWKDANKKGAFKEGTFLFYKHDAQDSIEECVHITNSIENHNLMESLFFACCESKDGDSVLSYSHIEHAITYGELYRDIKSKIKKGFA